MLDINLIRSEPDFVKAQLAKLQDHESAARIDAILDLDRQRREHLTVVEGIQQARNKLNKGMGRLRGDKQLDERLRLRRAAAAIDALYAHDYLQAVAIMAGEADDGLPVEAQADAVERLSDTMRLISDRVNSINEQVREVEAALDEHMLWLPNLPHESTPVGSSEDENRAWEPEGERPTFDFTPKPHWELGTESDIIDFERGVKMAGTRAYVLKGWGARLQRALSNFFLDAAREKGFEEVYLPFFVREEMMYGSSQFPKFRDVVYYDPDAEIYMLPTAEVALTNLYRDDILTAEQLPLNLVAHTPCFRREKMSAGKDVRGIKRVHQFQKVEMYVFTTPQDSYAALERLTEAASNLCRRLGLPFRRLEICTGDLGFSATKKYDIEVWSPGVEEWLEVSSCSNTEAFQARRANIKYRPEGKKKAEFVHTLNGSGLALPRVVIAILENYQQADGSVLIPEVLRPYLGGVERIPAPGTEDA